VNLAEKTAPTIAAMSSIIVAFFFFCLKFYVVFPDVRGLKLQTPVEKKILIILQEKHTTKNSEELLMLMSQLSEQNYSTLR